MKLALLFLFLSGCTFESEPELTCSWPTPKAGLPACLCSGRQPHSVDEARTVCCAAPDAPVKLCQEAP